MDEVDLRLVGDIGKLQARLGGRRRLARHGELRPDQERQRDWHEPSESNQRPLTRLLRAQAAIHLDQLARRDFVVRLQFEHLLEGLGRQRELSPLQLHHAPFELVIELDLLIRIVGRGRERPAFGDAEGELRVGFVEQPPGAIRAREHDVRIGTRVTEAHPLEQGLDRFVDAAGVHVGLPQSEIRVGERRARGDDALQFLDRLVALTKVEEREAQVVARRRERLVHLQRLAGDLHRAGGILQLPLRLAEQGQEVGIAR